MNNPPNAKCLNGKPYISNAVLNNNYLSPRQSALTLSYPACLGLISKYCKQGRKTWFIQNFHKRFDCQQNNLVNKIIQDFDQSRLTTNNSQTEKKQKNLFCILYSFIFIQANFQENKFWEKFTIKKYYKKTDNNQKYCFTSIILLFYLSIWS